MSVGFNDPAGWGYCECCAFLVAADPETGKLLFHEVSAIDKSQCNGSFWPADPTPDEAGSPNPDHRYRVDRPKPEVRREENPD